MFLCFNYFTYLVSAGNPGNRSLCCNLPGIEKIILWYIMSSKKIKQLKRKMKQYSSENILEFLNGLKKENFFYRLRVAFKIIVGR